MAESTLSLAYGDLQRIVGRHASLDSTPGNWTAVDSQRVDDVIEAALRRFYGENPQWSFLWVTTSLTTETEYNTGTIAISSGVVTLTGGTWPANAANYELEVESDGTVYEVSTRDSDTQLTLEDTTATLSSGASYTLARPIYDLPDDFTAIEGPFTYRGGESELYPPMQQINEVAWRIKRSDFTETEHPREFAIRTKPYDTSGGDRFQVMFWPSPDDAYKLYYQYKSLPGVLTSNTYPRGMGEHSATIEAAVRREAAMNFDETSNQSFEQDYQMCLARSLERDAQNTTPDFLGRDMTGDRAQWGNTYPNTDIVTTGGLTPYQGPW